MYENKMKLLNGLKGEGMGDEKSKRGVNLMKNGICMYGNFILCTINTC
jgi:hypothetical protein